MWPLISGRAAQSPRQEFPLTIGAAEEGSGGGFVSGSYKLIIGKQSPAIYPGPAYPNGTTPAPITFNCDSGCLYDIFNDPTEHDDLAASHPDIVATLTEKINQYSTTRYQTPFVDPPKCTAPGVQKVVKSGYWAPFGDIPYPLP